MADIAATDVTVTLPSQKRYFPSIPITISFPVVSWAAGKNYPAGGHGVPMPAGLFGMKEGIYYVPPAFASGYVCVYDATYNTIRIYQCAASGNPMVELAVAAAVPALTIPLMVVGE